MLPAGFGLTFAMSETYNTTNSSEMIKDPRIYAVRLVAASGHFLILDPPTSLIRPDISGCPKRAHGASGVVYPDDERRTDSAIFSCFYPIAVRTFFVFLSRSQSQSGRSLP